MKVLMCRKKVLVAWTIQTQNHWKFIHLIWFLSSIPQKQCSAMKALAGNAFLDRKAVFVILRRNVFCSPKLESWPGLLVQVSHYFEGFRCGFLKCASCDGRHRMDISECLLRPMQLRPAILLLEHSRAMRPKRARRS